MATKTVTITEEAYERLRAHKRPDESFTETILRLTGAERDVMAGFGVFADDDGFGDRTSENLGDALEERRERRERGL